MNHTPFLRAFVKRAPSVRSEKRITAAGTTSATSMATKQLALGALERGGDGKMDSKNGCDQQSAQ